MPDIDLDGAEVTPFQFHPQAAQQQGYSQYPQMAPQMVQRPGMAAPVVGGGVAGHDGYSTTTGSHYPTTVTDPSVAGMRDADWRGPSPGPSLGTSGTLPSSKDRDFADERRRLYVSNDERAEAGSSQGAGSSGGIVQHRDGGRVQEPTVPEEVPPSYDSIPPDEHEARGRG